MFTNITLEYNALRRKYNINKEEFISIIEAYLYYENEYKEHLIEDSFGTDLPLAAVYLLDYNSFSIFITRHLSIGYNETLDILEELLNRIKNRLDMFCVYDVHIEVLHGSNYMLRLNNKGNVLEIRYLDLLKIKDKRIGYD